MVANIIPFTSLSDTEQRELYAHEQAIEDGLKAYQTMGKALKAILDKRLYRNDYDTFDDYCTGRWNFSRTRAYQIMNAATGVEILSTNGVQNAPENERQMRSLMEFPEFMQPTILSISRAESERIGKPVSAKMIARVGEILIEAATTGHVDTGNGTSTPLTAALSAIELEADLTRRQRIREHSAPRTYIIPQETVYILREENKTHFIELPLTPEQYTMIADVFASGAVKVSVWRE
jgi:hypothetical protein